MERSESKQEPFTHLYLVEMSVTLAPLSCAEVNNTSTEQRESRKRSSKIWIHGFLVTG